MRQSAPRFRHGTAAAAGALALLVVISGPLAAQTLGPEAIEAARRAGIDPARLQAARNQAGPGAAAADTSLGGPGRASLQGIDDRRPAGEDSAGGPAIGRDAAPQVWLPFDAEDVEAAAVAAAAAAAAAPPSDAAVRIGYFGEGFFALGPGLFEPASFGPVPADYTVGVGDQIVIDVWGEVEFRLERIVERDGSILLPRGGKVACHGRTLAELERDVRARLARSYSGIDPGGGGSTFVDVSLGRLRAIRVFVVGDALRPGAYEVSSVGTVFTAIYAAGGPAEGGTLRDVRLVRDAEVVATLDLYEYLLEGRRPGDVVLRDGDTVLIPPRGRTVLLEGEVRRPLHFELREGEGLADLLRFGGGFTATAARELCHLERILPPAERRPEQPDRILRDLRLDPVSGLPAEPEAALLLDGDVVRVGAVASRLENWVEVEGNVKRPGRYEHRPGLGLAELIAMAGGLWADTEQARAIIDRQALDGTFEAVDVPLGEALAAGAAPVPLQARDRLRIFSVWELQERGEVAITGEVREPGPFPFREGMTLRDLVLKAGGLTESADVLRAEVTRLREDAATSRDLGAPPAALAETIEVPLGPDWLAGEQRFLLRPHDRVAVRRLPWWQPPRAVTLRGEVHYPGVYTLERPDERLCQVIARAGGLKPTAYAPAARIVRAADGVGNVAIDLAAALKKPGGEHDIVLKAGDEIRIPELPQTVSVTGAVGFPTSIAYLDGRSLGEYVGQAGGYSEKADKWRTRVVYPNGSSRPIRRLWRDPRVLPGSTIVVPVREPKEGRTLETLKDIAAIFASAATVYLVIDKAGE